MKNIANPRRERGRGRRPFSQGFALSWVPLKQQSFLAQEQNADPVLVGPKRRSLISPARGIARLRGKEPGQARRSGRGDQTMKTSTKGLHSVCGGGNAMRLSSSTRGRYASIRASGPVAVDVGSVVAPGANCRHSAGANCSHTIYLVQSLVAKNVIAI